VGSSPVRVIGEPVGHDREDQPAAVAAAEETDLLVRLRAGDERAFETLVEAHHGAMIAVARTYVKTDELAEEVVQETWLGVLKGIDRFEGRSSLKTWIMRILVNTAMTRGGREARSVPFSSLALADEGEPAVEPERFRPPGEAFAGHWARYPGDWTQLPEEKLVGRESIEVAKRAIEELPASQRRVITMRDVAGYSAQEVCEALDMSAGNQRVLLHRARSRARAALERHLDA
jgi:RNA polymerase sigma-70 factor, ECF subfamily